MNQYRILAGLVAMTLALPSYAVDGPTAPYNETVTTVNGKRVVEVMPLSEADAISCASHEETLRPTVARALGRGS